MAPSDTRVEALAEEVLLVAELEIARGEVVEHGVAEYVLEGVFRCDAAAAAADDHGELHLPIELGGERRIDGDGGAVRGDSGHRLGEHNGMHRRLRQAAKCGV